MKQRLGRVKEYVKGGLISAAVTALLGVVLLIWPGWAMKWMCILLGVLLTITGLKNLYDYIQHRKQGFYLYLNLVLGVILLGLGIWLLTNPGGLIRLIQYIFGAFVVMHGLGDLRGALAMIRQGQGKGRWVALGCAVLTLVLGAVILLNPLDVLETLIMLIGAVLIFDGLSSLWMEWQLVRLGRTPAPGEIIQTEGRELDP